MVSRYTSFVVTTTVSIHVLTPSSQLHIKVEKSVSRNVDGEITEVNLGSYDDSSPLGSAYSSRRNSEPPDHIENVIDIV